MVRHTQTIRRLLLANWLDVCDHFVGLALKGLTIFSKHFTIDIWQGAKDASECPSQ